MQNFTNCHCWGENIVDCSVSWAEVLESAFILSRMTDFANLKDHILLANSKQGRIWGEGAGGVGGGGPGGPPPPPPPPRWDDLRFFNTTGVLKKKTMWFIGVEVKQETSAPAPKKIPGSAPAKL